MGDRFSFGTDMDAEPVREEQGSNRIFLIFAIGLVGLIFLGILGVGFYFIRIKPQRDSQLAAQATQVIAQATAIAQQTALAPTETPLPTATPVPTETPLPSPTPKATNTFVVSVSATPIPGAAPTPTRTPRPGQTPQTGIGGLGAVLAAVGLVAIILVARKLRLAS
jgi:hypothetical protein